MIALIRDWRFRRAWDRSTTRERVLAMQFAALSSPRPAPATAAARRELELELLETRLRGNRERPYVETHAEELRPAAEHERRGLPVPALELAGEPVGDVQPAVHLDLRDPEKFAAPRQLPDEPLVRAGGDHVG